MSKLLMALSSTLREGSGSDLNLRSLSNLPGLKAQLEANAAANGGSSALPGFGKRLKSRRRRPFWPKGRFGQGFSQGLGAGGSVEPTVRPGPYRTRNRLSTSPTQAAAGDDTEVVLKTEEARQNLRPIFEGLYEELAEE